MTVESDQVAVVSRESTMTEEWDADLAAGDPLSFPGYSQAGQAIGREAVRIGSAILGDTRCVVIKSDFSVFGGSMGVAVGEKVTRAFRRATDEGLPVVAVIRTGGARMQEGMLSLIQMPRTVAAIDEHSAAGLMSIGILESPTTGGVFASWASLLDLRAAQAGATIGFAGPRVVEEMTGIALPGDSHTAESAYRAGLVDEVIPPDGQAAWVRAALGGQNRRLELPLDRPSVVTERLASSDDDLLARARDGDRASGLEWAAALCESWVEIKGGDPAIRAGLARVGGTRCVVVAMDRHAHGDGRARPGPEAYRLAQRAIALAQKLSLPVLTLVDTPGADPSPQSEARGVAGEIARTLRALDLVTSSTVSICVGEGGSGGAIALSHTDRLFLLQNSVYSVIGPEAAAVILWRDSARAAEATTALRIDSDSLLELGVSDGTLPEPTGAADVESARDRIARELRTSASGERWDRLDKATRRWLESVGDVGPDQSQPLLPGVGGESVS